MTSEQFLVPATFLPRTCSYLQFMKMKLLVTISIFTAALHFAPVAMGGNWEGKGLRQREGRFANLAPGEREKLKAAHDKARNDPAVRAAKDRMRQARKEFRDAMHAAMVKDDPSLQPILDKMPQRAKF